MWNELGTAGHKLVGRRAQAIRGGLAFRKRLAHVGGLPHFNGRLPFALCVVGGSCGWRLVFTFRAARRIDQFVGEDLKEARVAGGSSSFPFQL